MASNQPAPETSFSFRPAAFGDEDTTRGEWNPTEDSLRPVRGRHRVAKQRGLARSSTVLGVGVIAAVGAGGMATAQGKPPVSISLPDSVKDNLPDPSSLPGVGAFMSGGSDADDTTAVTESAEARAAQESAAAEQAAKEAAKQQSEAEAKAAAEKKAAEEAAKKKAEAERLAKLAASYALPTSSYTITSTFGQAGSLWSSGQHTGLDFAAPTGTPVKAVHGGTVKSAGWSGSYGYRTVLELDDGTEIWYCHQSSMDVTAGQRVNTGDTIGRVGATGPIAHSALRVSRSSRSPSAATSSAGPPTRPPPSPSSTRTPRPAATSSTPPTRTPPGSRATRAASRRPSSARG
ncbi:M23 family metallopeptidase [Streptomyces griseolus]|uniref:M23 family metallopeptidase n=1 Tax=Streptomyces griseolus TaxID=1909 RepID=UPI002243F5A0|nr:M23 family metallopeptidase [Streptomyces griseolus]